MQSLKKQLENLDKKYLWHPFTQMKEWAKETPIIITEGCGSFLKDISGRWYLDGVASIWVTVHGHRKKEIDNAIKSQIDKISHSTLLGLTHPPAIKLAEKLVQVVNSSLVTRHSSLSKVFYSDNGSTAVEIGLKVAFQYWQHKGIKRKKRFLSLNNAYHGDTIGAVSVGGIDIFHNIFSPLLFKSYKAPSPYCYRCEFAKKFPSCKLFCLKKMEQVMQKHHQEIAGLIIEPIMQGAGGMIVSPPGYLKGVRKLCDKYNILMIADEVATGFGRTGKMFACEHEKVSPDILCLAKGITGGYLPLAATITTEKIYNAFLGEFKDLKTFFHGHTYTGNQIACAAAVANLEIFKKEKTLKTMQKKIEILKKGLFKITELPHVGDVRQKGFMVGIELVKDKKTKEPYPTGEKIGWKVCYKARKKGLIIRPLGNVIVLMPPLSISHQELKGLIQITAEAIKEVTEKMDRG
ncbi:MAG: adenosylmethionine--8-amino-7-oxononanoate transaminase [Thermodesulfovibrionia bacterium]|nr:adenosylmethionine--8-amino-7-oxononanoate transaminase [Thermodesulfovibrionia bacterium]